ncbi:hypothetical protein [Haloimpatiens massiliensis]|uniref:hypothetical protein n=1 Tax=Haloimpatiens massiliensis TaxID=1658110 RepID=UPI000C8412D5|nr:hypothetical protein [Haloimpatiens massiliensis]
MYKVMPGVQIIFNEFCADSCFGHKKELQEDWLNLNYCFEGRFECEFPNNRYAFFNCIFGLLSHIFIISIRILQRYNN